MSLFEFLPKIPMDPGSSLDQLTGRFQLVKDGLPELVKNSKDQYARLSITKKADREIVVIVNSRKKAIGVLDFAGASGEEFENWYTWSSRKAGRTELADDIEAGHGNGGKAFMVRGSTRRAFIESCTGGKVTKMGFDNENPENRYFPAYITEDGHRLMNFPEPRAKERLTRSLREIGFDIAKLPERSLACFAKRRSYTLVQIYGIKDWHHRQSRSLRKMVDTISQDLASHGQAALTIASCNVTVILDGKSIGPLSSRHPDAMEGFENIPPIDLPATLSDPLTGETVSLSGGTGYLKLRTSNRQLRREDLRALNVIRIRNQRNVVGSWSVPDLVSRPSSVFVLGELQIPAIGADDVAGADRVMLVDTPLVRAVRNWVATEIDKLVTQIEKLKSHDSKPQDREKVNDALSKFREIMGRFLQPDAPVGDLHSTAEEVHPGGEDVPPGTDWGTAVDEIILEPGNESITLAAGTTIDLRFACYQKTEDGRLPVRPKKLELVADPVHVVHLVDKKRLRGTIPGTAQVRLRDIDSGIESNEITVQTVDCNGVEVFASKSILRVGERLKLRTRFATPEGPREDLIIEGEVMQPDAGTLSRSGWFSAKDQEGPVEVCIRFGPDEDDENRIRFEIVDAPVDHNGVGSGIPLILICGTEAPYTKDKPPEQRTIPPADYHPTIIEDPTFAGVVWINHESKEAIQVRKSRGGSAGMAGVTTKSFVQFLALKCFDVLKRLKVRQEIRDDVVTETQFTNLFAQAELDCAGFIDAAYELADQLNEIAGRDESH